MATWFLRNRPRGRRRRGVENIRWWRVVAGAALCLVVGSTETISTFFTMRCSDAAASWAPSAGASGNGSSSPSCWSRPGPHVLGGQHPVPSVLARPRKNETAGRRTVLESELIRPEDHEPGLLSRREPGEGPRHARRSRRRKASPVGIEGGQSLGLLGAAGFLGLLYAAVRRTPPAAGPNGDPRTPDDRSALRETLCGGNHPRRAVRHHRRLRDHRRAGRLLPDPDVGSNRILIAFFVMLQIAMWGEQSESGVRARNRLVARPLLGLLAVGLLAGTIALGPAIHGRRRQGIGEPMGERPPLRPARSRR